MKIIIEDKMGGLWGDYERMKQKNPPILFTFLS